MRKNYKNAKRNLIFGFGASLFVLLLSSVISYLSILQLLDSQQWVEHTSQVSSSLENLISRMKDAETGQRGYLLTGEETFLEPYTGSKDDVFNFYNTAQQLTSDNKSQQNDFPLLKRLINEKFNIIERTITDKKQGRSSTISTLVRGKAIMDSARIVIKAMNDREVKLMVIRNAKMNKFASLTPIFIGFAALIALLMTLFFYRKIQKNNSMAEKLEMELSEQKKTMERQIDKISDVAEKISKGDYSVRIDKRDLL